MEPIVYKSITAGVLIGLCADIYNRVGGIPGAILFGIGLVTICSCDLPLFTGRVGRCSWRLLDILDLFIILIYNIMGILLIRIIFRLDILVVYGIGCGCLMQIAVTLKDKPYMTVLCIVAFILAGYKHSIAFLYNSLDILDWLQILVGNIIGAKLLYIGGVRRS